VPEDKELLRSNKRLLQKTMKKGKKWEVCNQRCLLERKSSHSDHLFTKPNNYVNLKRLRTCSLTSTRMQTPPNPAQMELTPPITRKKQDNHSQHILRARRSLKLLGGSQSRSATETQAQVPEELKKKRKKNNRSWK